MAGLTHSAVVVVPDDPAYPVGTDEWNANHLFTGGAAGQVLFQGAANVISSSSGLSWDDALKKLTVTGSANALAIAGSATGAPITLTASGSDLDIGVAISPKRYGTVIIGAPGVITSPFLAYDTPAFAVLSSTGSSYGAAFIAANQSGVYWTLVQSRGTLAAPTATLNADYLSTVRSWGYGATTWMEGPLIRAAAIENFTDAAAGSELQFHTTASGTIAPVTRFTIMADGGLSLPERTAPALSTTGTGKLYVDATADTLKLSLNGGAYADVLTALAGVSSITGTANQVVASAGVGAVTLSLPQSIATTSTPQFAGVGIGAAGPASGIQFSTSLLIQDAANALTQRNGTSAQAFYIYNTYTNASNYERFIFSWSDTANNGVFGIRVAGTGTPRSMRITSGDGQDAIVVPTVWTTPISMGGGNLGALSATDGRVAVGRSMTSAKTSGTHIDLNIGNGGGVNPTSTSTLKYYPLWIAPTINYSNGTPGAGSYEALKIAVTETALPTGTNYLIRASAGAAGTTDIFSITNAGLVNILGASGFVQMTEITAPGVGAANTARLYAVDNGAGKTQLMVIFATGAAIQLAIEV